MTSGDWSTFGQTMSMDAKQVQELSDRSTEGTHALAGYRDELDATATSSQNLAAGQNAMGGYFNAIEDGFNTAGKAVDKYNQDVQTNLDDLAKKAPDYGQLTGSAYKDALSGKLDETIDNTQKQMQEILREASIAHQMGEAAAAAGDTHKAQMWAQLEAERTNTANQMLDELSILNAFSKSAGDAGYNAGKAWATNYTNQLNAALAQTARVGGETYSPGAPGGPPSYGPGPPSPYRLPLEGQTPAGVSPVPGVLPGHEMTIPEAIAKEAEAYDIRNAKHSAAAANEAATDARQQQSAQNALVTAQQKYELDTKQLELERNLTAAKNNLAAATDELTTADKYYQNELNKIQLAQADLARSERTDPALNAAKANQDAIARASELSQRAAAEQANQLAVAIHGVNEELYQMDQTVIGPMRDLQAQLQADTDAMKVLEAQTAAQDLQYTHMREAIEELQYQEQQNEKQVMGPLKAAYEADQVAVAAAQAKVQQISDTYDKQLIPLTDKLNKLNQEKNNIAREDTLTKEAQSAANLEARLKDLVPGSAEYLAVQKQLVAARRDLDLDTQIDQVTKQKDAIENRKNTALEAANAELKAAQAKAKVDKEAMDQQQKIFDQEKQVLADRAALLDHEQKLYDQQQRDKKQAIQDRINDDQAQIDSMNRLQTIREQADKDYLAQLNHEQQEQGYAAQQESYHWQTLANDAKDAVADLEKPYSDESERLKNLATDVRDLKFAFDESHQPIVDTLKDQADASQKLLDTFKDARKEVETATKWADAQAKYSIAIAGVKDSAPPASAAISDMAQSSGLLDTNTTAAVKALTDPTKGLNPALTATATNINTQVAPAVAGLNSKIDTGLGAVGLTFNKYFGQPSDPGYDATQSISWLMNIHNPDGFYSHLITWADIGLGVQGMRGMMDNRFNDMKTDITARATDLGNSIMGGIGTAVGSDAQVNGLAGAIAGAIKKAMGLAAQQIGSASPSKLAAAQLGIPLGMGVVMGVDSTQPYLNNSMQNLMASAFRVNYAPVMGGSSTNLGPMTMEIHFPNVTKLPENPNEWTARAADAAMQAFQRRMKQRGLRREIY